ncbi:MAG: hypothetical protein WC994_11170 [Brumimicrobium sp.]
MFKLIIYIILFALSIFFHSEVSGIGLRMGLSFTLSFVLPYILQFIFVCLILVQVNRLFLKNASTGMRRLVNIGAFVGLCGIAFAFHPIYEGDFDNEYNIVTVSGESEEVFEEGLTMVALPGCKFCFERVGQMNKIKKLFPDVPMHILIVESNETSKNEYREATIEGIEVGDFPPALRMNTALNSGSYPTFFLKSANQPNQLKRWSNSSFGNGAWDMVLGE